VFITAGPKEVCVGVRAFYYTYIVQIQRGKRERNCVCVFITAVPNTKAVRELLHEQGTVTVRICPLRSALQPVGADYRGQKARAALYLHAGVENDGGRQGRVRVWGMGLADHRAVHHERWHRPLQPKVQPSWRHILARESPAGGWPQCHLPSRPGRNSQKSALRWLYIVKYTRALTFLRTSARLQRGRLSAEGWT
jgi:hypothetical protein